MSDLLLIHPLVLKVLLDLWLIGFVVYILEIYWYMCLYSLYSFVKYSYSSPTQEENIAFKVDYIHSAKNGGDLFAKRGH